MTQYCRIRTNNTTQCSQDVGKSVFCVMCEFLKGVSKVGVSKVGFANPLNADLKGEEPFHLDVEHS